MRRKPDRTEPKPLVGFVGQGVVGKHLADDFEKRGLNVLRYGLQRKYRANIEKIGTCDVVFICVPTPMTPKGFDVSAIEESLTLVGRGKIAVIKSTVLPGTTKRLQSIFQELILLCSPEFLSATTAANDAAKPFSNIVGLPLPSRRHSKAAQLVNSILPEAPFRQICRSDEAELIKYAHTLHGYTQVLTFNLLYDAATCVDASWEKVRAAVQADPMISRYYVDPLHKGGRGAGGACFLKDFSAFSRFYEDTVARSEGIGFLRAAEAANVALLKESHKDIDIIANVYGSDRSRSTS